MATQTFVTLIDDLDGSEAIETLVFGLDGATYEIDLNAKNAKRLRDSVAKFVDNARRVPRAGTPSTAKLRVTEVRHSREHLQAVRNWARRRGYDVADKGRVPVAVMDEFEATH